MTLIRRPSTVALALGVALPPLYAAAVRATFRRNLRHLRMGDTGPLFSSYADDVRLVVRGEGSSIADLYGRAEVEGWVQRFVELGPQLEEQDILVTGPPWSTKVWLRYCAEQSTPDGELVHSNRGTIFGRVAWGKLTSCEVREDTQRAVEPDERLAPRD